MAGKPSEFQVGLDDILRCNRRCVPENEKIRKLILDEVHKSKLSIQPGATEMYQDLKRWYWGPSLKKHVAEYVAACLTFQEAKVEHQKPAGKIQSLEVFERK